MSYMSVSLCWCYLLSDTGEHKKNSSLSRYHQHLQEEKQRDRNVQTVSEKTHLSDSGSCHSLSHLKRKANFSSGSSRRVLASDKRDSKDNRNYSSHHRKDSGLSDRKHDSSKNADNRFRENVNGMLSTSRGHKSEQRRSISADSRSKPNVKQDFDSPVFRENLSNSALKERIEKKLGWINSLPHSTHQQHRREETRDAIKTAVPRKPHISTDAKHKTKVSSAVQDGTFTYYLWSPYVIGQTIIFSSCFFLLLLLSFFFFFPRLISAVGNWMFTVLWHMVWP